MKTGKYYLPISSDTLPHYLGCALILPAKYFLKKKADLQNSVPHALVLCSEPWVDGSDCSLELALNDREVSTILKVSEHFSTLDSPLPISRLKKVLFRDELQARTTVWNINNGAAFLPSKLIDIASSLDIVSVSSSVLSSIDSTAGKSDYSKKVKHFDHVLGGFSLLRIAGETYMDYSQDYFNLLKNFNQSIAQDVDKAVREKKVKFGSKDLLDVFVRKGGEWTKWQSYIFQSLYLEDVEKIAENNGEKVRKQLGIPQLSSIDPESPVYNLLVLAIYGESKNKGIDDFVTDIIEKRFPKDKIEELSFVVGFNNGYSTLRNRYRSSDFSKTVKFELNSKLDYYTIESIFQYVFYNIMDSSKFEFIDDFVEVSDMEKPGRNAYKVIDRWIVPKKKPQIFSPEYLENILEDISTKSIYKTATQSITKLLPPFVSIDPDKGEQYFEKELGSSVEKCIRTLMDSLKEDYREALEDEIELALKDLRSQNADLKRQLKSIEERGVLQEVGEDSGQEMELASVSMTGKIANDDDEGYETLTVQRLKEMAKERGIRPIPTRKEDLIKAIKTIKTLL